MSEHAYVLDFQQVDGEQLALVGGKGASLGALARIDGISVPPGVCVTTYAFQRITAEAPASFQARLDDLSRLAPDDHDAIRTLSAEVRTTLEVIALPDEIAAAITRALAELGEHARYAVRSSATAEDSPTASFAGQHDSYLNLVGPGEVLAHVSRCWASLFTERAVSYRLRRGLDHRAVRMAVVVQRMVASQAAGVLFTADPVTGNRRLSAIEATPGLGEGLVSGRANADRYSVRDGEIVAKPLRDERPLLTDAQVARLAGLGRRIEAHLGSPQDIEWCLAHDGFHIVQSRPITTLFPVPVRDDGERHVYVSVGHQQMMTDAMKPLGFSMWQRTAAVPMHEAGGRLFVDATRALASPASRDSLLELIGRSDPLTGDALRAIVDRGDFVPPLADATSTAPPATGTLALDPDPTIVDELIARSEDSVAVLARDIRAKSGPGLLDFILADIPELKRILFDPRSHQVFMTAMEASWWLDDHLREWLGERHAADTLTLSVPGNVTSEMGLALLDVADVIRPYPEVVSFLERTEGDEFLDELPRLPGGREARDAIRAWLQRYGMRCIGEIDITRPRWSERPATLLPMVLGNVRTFAPGEAARRVERGRQAAASKEQELLARLRVLPDGERKAEETKRMIGRVRTFIGYREYPKYGMVSRYFIYKRALMNEAERLVRAGVLQEREEIFWLTFPELHDVVRTHRVDRLLLRRREAEFRSHQALVAPRVLTSDGEVIAGSYTPRDLPGGALVGLGVSAGIVEGRARVLLEVTEADLAPGDILVTAWTDPSWTPLFVAVAGLVTEVGGLMTHGAVIAREYGLPAVVGVEHATRLIRDGQRIRVHGTEGFVEILDVP